MGEEITTEMTEMTDTESPAMENGTESPNTGEDIASTEETTFEDYEKSQGISDEDETVEEIPEIEESETETVAAEEKQEPEVEEPEKKEEPAAEKSEQVDTEEQQPVPPEQPSAEETAAKQTEYRNTMIEQLASQAYALDEDTAAQIMHEPEKVLPKLLAQMHVNIMEASLAGIGSALPIMIDQVSTVKTSAEKYRRDFYSQFSSLDKPEYHDGVRQLAMALRAQDPNADPKTFMKKLGVAASVTFGVPLPKELTQQETEETTHITEPAAVRRGTTSIQAPPSSAKPTNEFAALVEDDD